MEPKLVHIKTADGLTLPGLLFRAVNSKKVAIYLHGNGSSSVFYKDAFKPALARTLVEKGVSLLLFNNRGAHLVKKLEVEGKDDKEYFGMAFEKIKDCVPDIEGALDFLGEQGFKEFYLIGTSTGANKVVVYNHYKPKNRVVKYVLLNGGDDTGIYYDMLGGEKFFKLLAQAKEKIKKGQGKEMIASLLPANWFSYQGFYDIANPDGDYNTFPFLEKLKGVKLSQKPLFRYFSRISKPSLVVYGEKDEYSWGGGEAILKILREVNPDLDYQIIAEADHKFTDREEQVSISVARWLSSAS